MDGMGTVDGSKMWLNTWHWKKQLSKIVDKLQPQLMITGFLKHQQYKAPPVPQHRYQKWPKGSPPFPRPIILGIHSLKFSGGGQSLVSLRFSSKHFPKQINVQKHSFEWDLRVWKENSFETCVFFQHQHKRPEMQKGFGLFGMAFRWMCFDLHPIDLNTWYPKWRHSWYHDLPKEARWTARKN